MFNEKKYKNIDFKISEVRGWNDHNIMFEITFISFNFDCSKTVGDIWEILKSNA